MNLSRRLGWLFLLAVIVPSVLLAGIAVRAIRREEAYLEKQLEGALSAEVVHLSSLAAAELKNIQEELSRTAPAQPAAGVTLATWRESSALVGVPFLLSSDFELLWPRAGSPLEAEELSFLRSNRDFLSGRLEIPVYQNIALAYQEQMLPAADAKRKDSLAAQQAASQFESDAAVRKKAYEQAQEKGQKLITRNVNPASPQRAEEGSPQPSVFVAEQLRLDEITAGKQEGLIPRFVEERLELLFWKRTDGGRIVGCLLDRDAFRERLAGILPPVYTQARILTLLDEQGRPLFAPEEKSSRDYRRPFVAREVSELLPRWEAAVYLTDPAVVSARARLTAAILWVLICILFVSIVSGGALVLRGLQSEVDLARKKAGFVAGVSHELKTPLTSIRMYAEMLQEGRQPDPKKQERYLGVMVAEAQRLSHLVDSVLDFSQLEQGRRRYAFKPLDLEPFCRELLESQRSRLEQAGFAVSFFCLGTQGGPAPAGAEQPFADEEALRQVLLNLLSNAEKYSESSKEIRVELQREARQALIRVLDRGRGISAHQARHLFQEFYRADDALTARVKGTGLGLAIARRIVHDHGGEIRHFSRESGGSVFQVELPYRLAGGQEGGSGG